jgi:hypothetical protein
MSYRGYGESRESLWRKWNMLVPHARKLGIKSIVVPSHGGSSRIMVRRRWRFFANRAQGRAALNMLMALVLEKGGYVS